MDAPVRCALTSKSIVLSMVSCRIDVVANLCFVNAFYRDASLSGEVYDITLNPEEVAF